MRYSTSCGDDFKHYDAAGFSSAQQTTLPQEMVDTIEDCGFFESIPLWAVTLIGVLFITIMSFILIMTVYGRFFKLYIYTALSLFAASPPVVNPDAAAVTQVLAYIGELLFNMIVLVGSVKMNDRIIRGMMGL